MTATVEGFDAEREWVRSFWSALEPYHTSVYVNFLIDEGQARCAHTCIRQRLRGAPKTHWLASVPREFAMEFECPSSSVDDIDSRGLAALRRSDPRDHARRRRHARL